MAGPTGRTAGHVYAEIVASQLSEERAAKESLEKRAASGVTWAGALVAASLGLLATVADNPVAAVAVLVAAVCLAVAAYLGTRVINPADYREADPTRLREVIADKELMAADEQIGLRAAADQALDILEGARGVNQSKATTLRWQLRLLAAGAASLAVAVAAVVVALVCTAATQPPAGG